MVRGEYSMSITEVMRLMELDIKNKQPEDISEPQKRSSKENNFQEILDVEIEKLNQKAQGK